MLYRTFWQRVVASFIDGALLLALFLFDRNGMAANSLFAGILVLVLQHSYYIIGHAQYGQTVGKRLVNVRVVRAHQQLPARWKEAVMRELLWIVVSIMFFVVRPESPDSPVFIVGMSLVLLDALMAFVHPQNRSLRDFIGKTVVVRTNPVER